MEIQSAIRIFKEGRTFVAHAFELDVGFLWHQGKGPEESQEAVRLFLEETEKMGTLEQIPEEAGYAKMEGGNDRPKVPRRPANQSSASYRKLMEVFEAEGSACVRIEGDHMVFTRPGVSRPIVIRRYLSVPVRTSLPGLHSDFDILPQRYLEAHQPLHGITAKMTGKHRGHLRLIDSKQFGGCGLTQLPVLDDPCDLGH
jgi:hypothetical protein